MRSSILFALFAQILLAAFRTADAAPIVVDVNQTVNPFPGRPFYLGIGNILNRDIRFLLTRTVVIPTIRTDLTLDVGGVGGREVSLGGPLALDSLIDASLGFGASNRILVRSFGTNPNCNFLSGECSPTPFVTVSGSWRGRDDFSPIRGFLGFRLPVGNDWRYGWVDLTSLATGSFTIHRYAYESVVGTGIRAGAVSQPDPVPLPSTLSLFAVGALGLAASRRRRARRG